MTFSKSESLSVRKKKKVFGLSNLIMEKTREDKMDRQNKEWWGIEKDRKGEKPMCMINKRKTSWMGYMLCRICLLQKIMEEKVEGKEGRGRRRFGILTNMKEGSSYQQMKMFRTMWNAEHIVDNCLRTSLWDEVRLICEFCISFPNCWKHFLKFFGLS